jgi:hypothetical protein
MFEELAVLHYKFIMQTPEKIQRGVYWPFSEWDGELIARSSRTLEPFVYEAVDVVLQPEVPQRLLEVGAGSGVYMRYAVENNPQLAEKLAPPESYYMFIARK